MHITKIELEDIKSHAHFLYEFERGTTAITGANGAGKTTLIEAVAWTLFDLLDYKKDDFVRRGAKKGVVRVTFESGFDGREYIVYRDTGTGYNVYDPQIKMRIADKKEEVARFLWTHLGVEPGTDLEALFRRAIGVPQGTFTAIFIESAAERKKAFDKLLKVEEYRQSADKLRETMRFIESKIVSVRERIARAEGELTRFEFVETELKNFRAEAESLEKTLVEVEKEAAEKRETVKRSDATEKQVNDLKNAFERLSNETARAEILLSQKESDLKRAQISNEKIKAAQAGYQAYVKAVGMLKELERERGERERITRVLNDIETSQISVKAEQNRIQTELEKAQNAHLEIAKLKPQVVQQENFEKEISELRKKMNEARSVEGQITAYEKEILQLREDYKTNKIKIDEAQAKSKDAENLEKLQKRDDELKKELADLRAKFEADKRFQREIKNGLCPILSEKCLNLKPGQTLENFLGSQFTELQQQISVFETEQIQLSDKLKTARDAEKALAALETYQVRDEEITLKGKRLAAAKAELVKQTVGLEKYQAELIDKELKLKEFGSPKEKIKLLEIEAGRETDLRLKLTETEKNLERLENDRGIEREKLESYKDLDANWKEFSALRDRSETDHREFLANETEAETLPAREKEFGAAQSELEKMRAQLQKAEVEFSQASKDYDRERHQTERAELFEAEKRLTETQTNFTNAQKRAEEFEKELAKLAEIRREMQGEFEEKERLERISEATEFIRDTLKKSAPLVARNYVYHVSLEANQMFREITGDAERTLRWTEDYGIMLEEAGYERPFVNLSGGEQMAAALSVRLALLKQLSDVRLAFFDEPTTNMDAARRENLAQQISQITERQTFDQLFVISHDDTFENYVDHVVSVGGREIG